MIVSHLLPFYILTCDICGLPSSPVADGSATQEGALRHGLSLGWLLNTNVEMCPECAVKEPCS